MSLLQDGPDALPHDKEDATTLTETFRPHWHTQLALAGLAWNLYGVYQFASSLTATPDSLMAAGMTAAQAAVMSSYPIWMTVAFGLGVGLGTLGSALLALRRKQATPVLAVSLVAYLALWIGDAVNGVFAALGTPQIVILTLVVAIAAALLALARRATLA